MQILSACDGSLLLGNNDRQPSFSPSIPPVLSSASTASSTMPPSITQPFSLSAPPSLAPPSLAPPSLAPPSLAPPSFSPPVSLASRQTALSTMPPSITPPFSLSAPPSLAPPSFSPPVSLASRQNFHPIPQVALTVKPWANVEAAAQVSDNDISMDVEPVMYV